MEIIGIIRPTILATIGVGGFSSRRATNDIVGTIGMARGYSSVSNSAEE